MFIRLMQISRLISHQKQCRLFSSSKSHLTTKQEPSQILTKENQTDILPVENRLPALAKLPSYLPEPTGVKSKLFDEFYLIYRFGLHRPLRYVQVLKLTQTLVTALITPYQVYCYNEGLITLFELQLSVFFLSLASFSLFMFGWAATRTICFLYTTVDCDRVILSHIDFWGRRRDTKIDTSDIVPINDIETPDKTILPFKRYSTNYTMYYAMKIGQILDRPRFNRVFAGVITQDTKNWW